MSTTKFLGGNMRTRRWLPRNYSNRFTYDDLLNAESELGRTIFGPIPAGHQREFFELKRNVWIWHESFLDNTGRQNDLTVRYEVRPNGVYKSQNGADYKRLNGGELDNFRQAAAAYLNIVKAKLYS